MVLGDGSLFSPHNFKNINEVHPTMPKNFLKLALCTTAPCVGTTPGNANVDSVEVSR
jgi:hypothetical protein